MKKNVYDKSMRIKNRLKTYKFKYCIKILPKHCKIQNNLTN